MSYEYVQPRHDNLDKDIEALRTEVQEIYNLNSARVKAINTTGKDSVSEELMKNIRRCTYKLEAIISCIMEETIL